MNKNSIPKKIHYCWFGKGEMPKLAQKCIESWKKYLPDYEIILWNEEKFDVNSHPFTKIAYEKKKYAFVTDYVRLYALYSEGGIYMDTDVEVVKNLDDLLSCSAFSGFENEEIVPTGIMASVKSHPTIKILLNYYDENPEFTGIPNTKIISDILERNGLKRNGKHQILKGNFHIYPRDYFCPIDYYTGEMFFSKNTYTIHHFAGSWLSKSQKFKKHIKYSFINIFGLKTFQYVKKLIKN